MVQKMRLIQRLAALCALGTLAACGPDGFVDGVSRTAPVESGVLPDYAVREIVVDVPRTLSVSDANLYYPIADIVWREDLSGDRYLQVQDIFTESAEWGASIFDGVQLVDVEIVVTRFHAVTPKARYTVGGVHSMRFELTVRDASTGDVLQGPRSVIADLQSLGGQAAVDAETQGITQRGRITQHLAGVLQRELRAPVPGT